MSPHIARAGLAYIPEDRASRAAPRRQHPARTISRWASSPRPLAGGRLTRSVRFRCAGRGALHRALRIKIAQRNPSTVGSLSGGNLQKIVVARELAHEAPAADRGAADAGADDVGATEFIHAQIVAERDKGRAILLRVGRA